MIPRFVAADDLQIAVWEQPGENPPLFFGHATGFHGRVWDSVIDAFPGRRALAVEFRGHGRSSKPAPPIPWRRFADDVLAVARELAVRGAIGVGHSMGGHALAEAAALEPGLFRCLVLVDPVIFSAERYGAGPPNADFIERRRDRFASPGEMFERFHARAPFAAWRPEILRNYCDYGLLPDGGEWMLACRPRTEAEIYRQSSAPESNIRPMLRDLKVPVTILRAGSTAPEGVFDLAASPTAADIASLFPNAREIYLPDRNHYIPMETPEIVAAEIEKLLLVE